VKKRIIPPQKMGGGCFLCFIYGIVKIYFVC